MRSVEIQELLDIIGEEDGGAASLKRDVAVVSGPKNTEMSIRKLK